MEATCRLQRPVIDFDAIPDVFNTAIKVNSLEEIRQVFEDGKSRYHLGNEAVYNESHFKEIISKGELVSLENYEGKILLFRDCLEFYVNEEFNILDFSELPMIGDDFCESELALDSLWR